MGFSKDYVKAQHSLEITEAGGMAAFEIAVIVITAGAGAAASVRHLGKLGKLKPLMGDLVKLLKRKRAKKSVSGSNNKTLESKNRVKAKPKGGVEVKVKCFNKRQDKHSAKEYDRQLKNQQDGLNNMSADDYLDGRRSFSGIGCKNGKITSDKFWDKEKNRPKRNSAEAQKLRKKHKKKLEDEFIDSGMTESAAKTAVKQSMKSLAALHNPDMVAAGKDVITGFGDRGINSSIGTQWQDRVSDMDKAACKSKKEDKGHDKMNVELKRCKKG